MAVVNRNSVYIANAVAVPPVLNDPHLRNVVKEAIGEVTPATDDSATSVARLLRVPTNARISELMITSAAFTTAGNVDVGVYRTAEDGGAVVDADFFASALALTAAQVKANILNESTTNTLAKQQQPLWQALGVATDPGGYYDIAYTITTTFNGGQQVSLQARYV